MSGECIGGPDCEDCAAEIAEAEQRGREDNADHGMCYVSGSKALEAILDERDALRAQVERVEALADELAHPDPDLIVPFERAVHRNVAAELRHALNGCPECDGPQ